MMDIIFRNTSPVPQFTSLMRKLVSSPKGPRFNPIDHASSISGLSVMFSGYKCVPLFVHSGLPT